MSDESRTLFNLGDFTLHSGQKSNYKIDADMLTHGDIECVAALLAERLPAFGHVEGVPTGGLRLAEALGRYVTEGPLLLVDDVWTSGTSMQRQRAGREALGAVIFARTWPPFWIMPFLIKPEGRLCRPIQPDMTF